MEFRKILIFLTIICPTFSKSFGSWEDDDNSISDLKWLFNGEETKSNEEEDKYIVCDTKQCQIVADEFKHVMNKSADPCHDFYEYVCGNWNTRNPIPPYEYEWDRFKKFQHVVYSRIKEILEVEPVPSDILPVKQAKKWYRSCMNTDALERKGLRTVESTLVQLGGWPMTMDYEEWDENEHSWQSIEEHYFHITGEYIFYEVTTEFNSTKKAIGIESGDLPLNYVIESKHRNYSGNNYDNYIKLIDQITEIFIDEHKADVPRRRIENDVRNLVEFEKKLYLLKQNKTDFDWKSITIDNFIKTYSDNLSEIEGKNDDIKKIDFRRVIRRVYDMVNIDIEDSTAIYVVDTLKYWIELTKILNETPKRTIVNYIHWHFVSGVIEYTTKSMRDLLWHYREHYFDVTGRVPRWLECVYEMKMESAAGYAFTQKYFYDHTETDVREMVYNIRDQMKSQIKKTSWLDEESKESVLNKLDAIKIIVGFPDWYKNKTTVLNSYKGLSIGTDHLGNALSYYKYQLKRSLQNMTTDASFDPTIVNGFYDPMYNSIELPAADFQPPLFTSKLPRSINYGIAGLVIGHEIGHAFDDSGIKFGIDGNKTQISEYIMDMYYKRAECFLHQYNEYWGVTESDYDETTPSYGEGSIGRRTRGENIADSTGLHSVFEAYQKMIDKLPNGDYRLPGFEEYSDSQMFFISFAGMWCGERRTKFAARMDENDVHAPARLRVIGAVSNTNDFAQAFKCPKGTPMNPDNKCSIWKSVKKHSDDKKKSESLSCHKSRSYGRRMNW